MQHSHGGEGMMLSQFECLRCSTGQLTALIACNIIIEPSEYALQNQNDEDMDEIKKCP